MSDTESNALIIIASTLLYGRPVLNLANVVSNCWTVSTRWSKLVDQAIQALQAKICMWCVRGVTLNPILPLLTTYLTNPFRNVCQFVTLLRWKYLRNINRLTALSVVFESCMMLCIDEAVKWSLLDMMDDEFMSTLSQFIHIIATYLHLGHATLLPFLSIWWPEWC